MNVKDLVKRTFLRYLFPRNVLVLLLQSRLHMICAVITLLFQLVMCVSVSLSVKISFISGRFCETGWLKDRNSYECRS